VSLNDRDSPRIGGSVSRAPVIVLIVGGVLAVSLVLIGAQLAAAPARLPAQATPGTPAAPREVNVILRDYRFDPTPLYLFRGETVRLNVLNGGMLQHELVLGGSAVQQAWADADARATPPAAFATAPPASVAPGTDGLRILLGSGQSSSVVYRVPADESLGLICHLPGHVEEGMVGEVVLLDPPTGARTPSR
jgi:uncharacterized cupredoxin-like copper-binding protein